MDFSTYLIYGVPVLAIIMGLVKLARMQGLPSQYAPLFSVALGIACGCAVAYVNGMNYLQGGIYGLIAGLSASGLYDTSKFKEILTVESIETPEIIKDESGSAKSIVVIMTIAFIGIFMYFICLAGVPIYICYVMAACALIGYMLGAFSRFKYTKILEKQVIEDRLEKI